MHIADVDQGMLGANGIDTLAVPLGQITAVSTGDGLVIIAGQSQKNTGDVTAGIGGSATTGAVTDTVSKAITALGKTWSGQNVTIGQTGVGTQLTNSFVNLAHAILVAIALV